MIDEWNETALVELCRKIGEIAGNYEINGLVVMIKVAETDRNLGELAEKLGVSVVDELENHINFRPIHLIPHIVTLLGIVRKRENYWYLIYDQKCCQDDVPFETFLRYSYSNLPKFDLQRINFLSHSLLETYTQLYQRGIQAEFRIENFHISTDLWLKYDIFGEFAHASKQSSETLEEIQCKWIKRKISNFEYLEILNRAAGRVRGEVHNHPIFPWVTDFCGNLRPLNRTKYRLNKGDDQLKEMYSREPSHHVPELLSDIGYMSYRARIESKENLCKYVRRKWVPEEYPTSIVRMYQWTPDECIPELYENPEIFTSIHPDMTDLKLPEFIETPREFIKYHRDVLESEEVSMNLHRWIDLVFGVLLSEEKSVQSLNRHLCYVQKNARGLRCNGMVQLFQRAHPQRDPEKYKSQEEKNRRIIETGLFDSPQKEKKKEIEEKNNDDEGLYEIYRNARKIEENGPKKQMMKRIIEIIALLTVSPHMVSDFSNNSNLLKCVQHAAYSIPANYRNLIDQLLVRDENWPTPQKFAFLIRRVFLNLPAKILDFHAVFGQFQAFHGLRRMCVVGKFSKRAQVVLLKEVDFLKKSIRKCHFLEFCVVTAFQNLLEDEEACIQAVHKLMPVITRCLSQSALEDLIKPMIELIQSDTSVKLLDRRFLLSVSICYGSRKFVDLFIPPIIEACASRNENRSIVAKESIMWLAKRYGPVICAKFITSNLLRIIASCYDGFEVACNEKSVFSMILVADSVSSRLESLLSEIVLTWSVTFITVQYLPFCVDLIDVKNYKRRGAAQFETGLVSVFRIVEVSVRGMTDNQLMTYLEEYIVQKVLDPVILILLDETIQFSSDRVRNVLICKFLQLLFFVSQRIGTENTRIYASEPFKKLFETFSELYEANDELTISAKSGNLNLYPIPVWIVRQVIDKFTETWSVPFLSQFCPDPAFLIPFVSASPPQSTIHLASSPSTFNLSNNISGNRLFSLSSSSSSQVPTIGGVGVFYGENGDGNLSRAWCAKISAAVCGASTERFDHLILGTFSGHNNDRIRKLAAISNENSFVSASSDKTVKLWSVKPELDEVECQWTYRNHTKSVTDVTILADNLIASTDGHLHIWDPFRAQLLAQTEWDAEGGGSGSGNGAATICALANVDRHTVATISSLHATVKLFDTRVGGFSSELKVTPGSGVTRAISVKENDHKLAVAMSNGSLAILDARNGKITLLAQIHSTRVHSLTWVNATQLLVADSDDVGMIVETKPYAKVVRKLDDAVVAAAMMTAEERIVTLQMNSMLRIYKSRDISTTSRAVIETRLRSDQLAGGQPTACLPLSLNSAYLIGTSHGQIKLIC